MTPKKTDWMDEEKKENEYCCKGMKEADKEEVIDYCEPNLTTIDAKGWAFPISYCPFCCKKLEGSIASMERITNAAKEYSTKFIPKSPTEHQRGGQACTDSGAMDSKERGCACNSCGNKIISDNPRKLHCDIKCVRRAYYQKNKEKLKKDNRDYTKKLSENPELIALKRKKWREYYHKNGERYKTYDKEYYQENKESISEKTHEFYLKNKKRLNARSAEYTRKHRPVANRLRAYLSHAFNMYSEGGKVMSSNEYGIDYNAIVEHLGPCPGDRKDYHIDHITPISSFDFDDPEQVRQAFLPENHQWLLAEENISKGNRVVN